MRTVTERVCPGRRRRNPWRGGHSAGVPCGRGGDARSLLARGAGVVRHHVRRAHRRPGQGLARDRGRRPHPDPRPHRVGQDPRRVPVGDRPPRVRSRSPRRPSGRGSSTSRRSRPSRSTWRRTSGRRSRASGPRPSGGARPCTPPPSASAPATPRPRSARALRRHPPDILITTPESLYLMLTSGARETLRDVRWVIVDEIHAIAGTKRGAHLALSLERLDAISKQPPQRIGLSATQRPLDEIARFLGGRTADGPRPVTVVDAGVRKELDLEVIVPIEDMGALGARIEETPGTPLDGEARSSIWPHVHPRILEQIRDHRTTLIFCNNRRLAERLAARLNELAGEELVKAHHGSLAREQRLLVEDELKTGRLRALVATSSLELGIDMGTVDLVIQVESPGAVSRGLQRIGRAGHQVGEPSTGKIFPKYRGDLLEVAVVVERMRAGAIESTRIVRNPLDVLAQQIVAMCAVDEWDVDDLAARRARRRQLRRARRRHVHRRPRPPRGPVPVRRVRGAATAHRVGPAPRHRAGPRRRRPHRDHQRRHHPRPRAVRRVPPRGHARRRARRGDGLREPAGRDVRPRREHVADRPDHPRPRDRAPGARRAGEDAVLARRPAGPAHRARPGHRRVHARPARPHHRRRRRVPARRDRARRARGAQPRRLPRRAGGGHRRAPRRPHHRRRALPRRARRLAHLRAHAVRRPRARAVGHGAAQRARRAARRRRPGAVERRRHRAAPPRRGGALPRRGPRARSGAGGGPRRRRAAGLVAVRRPVPRGRGPGAAPPQAPAG